MAKKIKVIYGGVVMARFSLKELNELGDLLDVDSGVTKKLTRKE